MAKPPESVSAYIADVPDERRAAIKSVRATIRKHLPKGYKEGIQYGMIGYFVPHSVYPAGYHCDPSQPVPFIGLGNQKNHLALYLFCVYTDRRLLEWFTTQWRERGRKLDMGKSCLRFKKLEDVDLELLGQLVSKVPVESFLASYESAVTPRTRSAKASPTKKPASKKAASKKAGSKKAAPKKAAARRSGRAG